LERSARRNDPPTSHSSAPGGLVFGGDDQTFRRALLGMFANQVVGRAHSLEAQNFTSDDLHNGNHQERQDRLMIFADLTL
jgi:hypothetical protein